MTCIAFYGRKGGDTAGYVFQGGLYCPGCICDRGQRSNGFNDGFENHDPEDCLAILAGLVNVLGGNVFDRFDENTFDSNDFPKVLLVDNLSEWDNDPDDPPWCENCLCDL